MATEHRAAKDYNPRQRRDGHGRWSDGSGISATGLAKVATNAAKAVIRARELGLLKTRSLDEAKATLKAGAPESHRFGAHGALKVVSGAIDAYEIHHHWREDWGKVSFATVNLGLTTASLLAPPAAPALLGVGLITDVLGRNKRVNDEVGKLTTPGWEWFDRHVVSRAASLPHRTLGGPAPPDRQAAPAATSTALQGLDSS